jgi:hypothetical protein
VVFYLAFRFYVDSRRNEPKDFSFAKILGILVVAIPTALVLIVFLMKSIDCAKEHLFIVWP